jgi:dephospho-CoA kinase
MNRQVLAERETDHLVVMDIPLLTENPRNGLQARIVVDVPVEAQVERLVAHRGFDEADARARIARQSSREDRLKLATHVIDNSGDLDALVPQVAALWDELRALPQLPPDWEFPKPEPAPEQRAEPDPAPAPAAEPEVGT